MKTVKYVMAAVVALLLLQNATPALAWEPTFPGAPYEGFTTWWRSYDTRINWYAYGMRWSQQGINAAKGDLSLNLDMTADCRDTYADDGDKLNFNQRWTNLPWLLFQFKDDCGNSSVHEEAELFIDPWLMQPDFPYWYWVEYQSQLNAVGGELNLTYQRLWPTPTHDWLDQKSYYLPAGAGSYDDLNKAIFYKGGTQADPGTHWRQASGSFPRAYGGNVQQTNYEGPWFSIGFSGSSITWVYTMASNRGSAQVFIDGQPQGTVSQLSLPSEIRWQAARTWQVSPGEHWFKVVANGDGYVDVDRMIVDVPAVAAGSRYDDFNSAVGYIGSGWWSSTGYPSAYNSSLHWTCHDSSEDNDGAYMFFTGSRIGYIYTKIYNRGIVNVTIDGQIKGDVDLYDPNLLWQQETTWDVGSGIHNIQVTCTWAKNGSSQGYQVDLDAFRVSN